MLIFPKIEKVTKDATFVHFFLMFGYKIFSLYFPLFLIIRGFSLPEVGYTYLLIYLPLALFSPVVGFLNHKINPAILTSVGIFGYGVYALGMILIENPALFFFWQVLLGISAALFFVSVRAILIGCNLENPGRAFGWFYSAPFYADAIAPAVGAVFVWQFGFVGVFVLSLIITSLTAIYCFKSLEKSARALPDIGFNLKIAKEKYRKAFQTIRNKTVLPFISLSLTVLFLAGFYKSYFVLFLKDELYWSQNLILVFISVFSIIFLPLSLRLIKYLGEAKSEENIIKGGTTAGLFSILFGTAIPFLNFFLVLLISIGRSTGNLICNAGRSGLVSQK